MADRSGYTKAQRERIAYVVFAAVLKRRPGPVVSVDALMFEEIALPAACSNDPASAAQLSWVRGLVAEAMAARESTAFR